ncbi:hypothetical protein KKA09_04280 [Patescibacteria group bacterium]|nr:hypothetical protein [Patescibacteria group bacterium]
MTIDKKYQGLKVLSFKIGFAFCALRFEIFIMFFSRKKIFSFLLLISLLTVNSFVLAGESTGPVWEFTTATSTEETPPPPPGPPISWEPQSAESTGPVWEFTTATSTEEEPPLPPTEPITWEQKSAETTGPVWEFTTATSTEEAQEVWEFTTKPSFYLPVIATSTAFQAYCISIAGQGMVGFQWTYIDDDGDKQTGFDFRVNNVNDVNDGGDTCPNCEINRQYTGLNDSSGAIKTQSVFVKDPLEADKIAFNKTYCWWVRVYNDKNEDSGWIAAPSSFTVPAHAYPYPAFFILPSKPKVDAKVTFMQDSVLTGATCYNGGEHLCQSDNNANYKWDFNYPSGIDSFLKGNPTTTYSAPGTYEVMLEISDLAGTCAIVNPVVVYATTSNFALPKWREVAP